MLKLVDNIFQSELTKLPNIFHKIITVLMVLVLLYSSFQLFGIEKYNKVVDNVKSSDNVTSSKYVYNNTDLKFNRDVINYINEINSSFFSSKFQPEIIIYVDNQQANDINKKANEIFNNIGIGSVEYNTGVLIYLNTAINPTLRIEVGYGLEDVINDAKAGRIIDDNVKQINSTKELKEFNNEELTKLLTYLFIDISSIIDEAYKIDAVMNKEVSEKSEIISNLSENIKPQYTLDYRIVSKETSNFYIYLFAITIFLLYFRALKYKYVFKIFLWLVITGYTVYAFINGSFAEKALLILFIPLIMVAFSNKDYQEYVVEMRVYRMPRLMVFLRSIYYTPQYYQYDCFTELPYRYLLNNFVTYYVVYLFLLLMIQKYALANMYVIFTIFIVIIMSVFLLIKESASRIVIPYSMHSAIFTALVIDSNMIFATYLLIAGIILFIYNLFMGYSIHNHGNNIDSEFIGGIFNIIFNIIYFIFRLILIILTAGRFGGGSSGGGGASR